VKTHRAVILTMATVLGMALVSCGGGDDNPVNPGGGGADVTINIVGDNGSNSYDPDPDTVNVGQTVAWRNVNGTAHTATSDNGTTFGTGAVGPGSTSATIGMNTPGTFAYHCTIHSGMTGRLVVR
jgi:plastocyanin